MKRIVLLLLFVTTFGYSCDQLSQIASSLPTNLPLSQNEVGMGLKEALTNGVLQGIGVLNQADGFYKNNLYKLFLPDDAQKIVNTLQDIGMGSLVDKAVLQVNRAAEDAMGYAKPIFLDAIKQMTFQDAMNILRGGNNAATLYFKEKTTNQLMAAFSPVIKNSLDKVNATKYYGDVINTYNKIPLIKKLNPDLNNYVAQQAVNALFDQIGKEEANIRQNPVARTTELLRRVFGGQ